MHATLTLNARQQQVLWATVQQYVSTAEPVASKVLAHQYDLNISPATIRHVMGFLEKSGLLFQPYTSAGRVPSDFGYRLYVDQLMHPQASISKRVDSQLSQSLNWDGWSLEALLQGAAQILATLSGYLTLITVPRKNQATIRHLQLVALDETQVLLSVVLDSLETQSMVIQLPAPEAGTVRHLEVLEEELKILSNFLRTRLAGQLLLEITNLDWGELGLAFQRYGDVLTNAMGALAERNRSLENDQFVISGLGEVIRQPEFSATQQMQAIIHLLEEKQTQLWPLVFEAIASESQQPRVRVWIGSENPLEPMQECALVSSTYYQAETPLGSVSVLGPKRMMYENAIAAVEATADYLSDAFNPGF